ncbi:MAG: hypothetical protein D6767_05155 [Candidatus Hydrogenedentota bacterium]|nr:MAG: hypothetical protein D6767_05155 [Candidatus Hydrogenedentota bacterium]
MLAEKLENWLSSFSLFPFLTRYKNTILTYVVVIFFSMGFAKLTATYLELKLTDASKRQQKLIPETYHRAKVHRSKEVRADISELIGGPIFEQAPVQTEENPQAETPVATAVPFELLGTLEGDPSFARAVIRELGGKNETREVATYEKIGNAVVLYIGREYIWVKENGRKFKVKVGERSNQVNQPVTAQQTKPSNITSGQVIKKVISREEVNKIIKGNPATIYKDAAFGPYLVGGKIKGYKIHRVKPTHIFYKLGARAGDIIEKVNGFELSDTERMFELWKSIKTAPRVTIQVLRNNKRITYDFVIQN